jgi:hypothetical protein
MKPPNLLLKEQTRNYNSCFRHPTKKFYRIIIRPVLFFQEHTVFGQDFIFAYEEIESRDIKYCYENHLGKACGEGL